MQDAIKIGDQAFISDGDNAFGAVRAVLPNGQPELVIYIENSGDFTVPLDAVEDVHSHKVIIDYDKLAPELQEAINMAHQAETPG